MTGDMNENSSGLQSKPRYEILTDYGVADGGCRFHIFEAHAASPLSQVINHGLPCGRLLFLLSRFVVGYAYDDRWGRMGLRVILRAVSFDCIRWHYRVVDHRCVWHFTLGRAECFR